MAKGSQELYHALRRVGEAENKVMPGIVKGINNNDTIDVEIDGLVYYEVRTKAAVNDGQKGISIIPTIDSVVIIEKIGSDISPEFQVVMFSEVDEYTIEIDSVKLLIDQSGFLVKKGDDTLKDVIKLIIEAVQKIVVLQGNNPDYIKLTQALSKTNNLLK